MELGPTFAHAAKPTRAQRRVIVTIGFGGNRGEVFGLLGPNGGGKTTILETIEGLRPVQSGQVSVAGVDVAREPRRVSRMIGVQLQHVAFFDRLTLDELLRLFADLYEGPARPEELLELVGLTRQRRMYARQLSGGQRQRLSIAVALVNEPVAVLLDEPTSGLDPKARHTVWELVRRLRERGLAVVLTSSCKARHGKPSRWTFSLWPAGRWFSWQPPAARSDGTAPDQAWPGTSPLSCHIGLTGPWP